LGEGLGLGDITGLLIGVVIGSEWSWIGTGTEWLTGIGFGAGAGFDFEGFDFEGFDLLIFRGDEDEKGDELLEEWWDELLEEWWDELLEEWWDELLEEWWDIGDAIGLLFLCFFPIFNNYYNLFI
jgi:hypothetical protein